MRILRHLVPAAALAAGFVLVSFAGAARGAGDAQSDVMTMDVDFLREKLLKLYIIEEASDRHNQKRIAEDSFKGMAPLVPTGDEAVDAENRAAYLKNDKALRHYLLLEYDNSIEAIDICNHVLGTALRAPRGKSRAVREFLDQEVPAIDWRSTPLAAALQDLGRKIHTPVDFSGIAKNEDVRIDLNLEGFTVEQTLEFIRGIHEIAWEYKDGRLIVRYLGGSGE